MEERIYTVEKFTVLHIKEDGPKTERKVEMHIRNGGPDSFIEKVWLRDLTVKEHYFEETVVKKKNETEEVIGTARTPLQNFDKKHPQGSEAFKQMLQLYLDEGSSKEFKAKGSFEPKKKVILNTDQ